MARRHSSLIPLSHDHYEGLLLAHQLREPGRRIMKGWPDSEIQRRQFVAQFYHEHLAHHFLAEEESLFPLVVEHIPQGKSLVEDLLGEHRQIEGFVGEFERAGGTADSQRRLKLFSELLEGHIRKEERQLFPLFEEHAPPEVLAAAEEQIHRHYPRT